MTVKELKKMIASMNDNERVVGYLEIEETTKFFDIIDVTSHRGNPQRNDDGEAGYVFDSKGVVNWTFINLEDA